MRVTKQNKLKKLRKEIRIYQKVLLKLRNWKETITWQAVSNSFWKSEQTKIVLIGLQYRAIRIKIQEE